MTKTAAWQPALNELNCAIGTYKGIFTDVVTRRDGEEFEVENAYFAVLGEDGKEKPIPVRMPGKYHSDNAMGELGKALGFEYQPRYEENENGFKYLVGDNLQELDAILENFEEKVFTFKISRNPRGLWDIKLATLKPYNPKKKAQ